MDYQKEFYKLFGDIKYKLSKLYLTKEEYDNYEKQITEIALKVNDKSTEFNYYEAFLKAVELDASINALINSKKDLILPAYETDSYLLKTIVERSNDIKRHKRQSQVLRTRLISYILTGAIFATAGAYTILRNREIPEEKLYLTTSTTYYDNTGSVRRNSSYTKEMNTDSEVIIKKITPWIKSEKDATRYIYTYHLKDMTYDQIIGNKNYEDVINNLTYEESTDTMSRTNLQGIFEYDEPIYEITEIKQSEDRYVTKNYPLAKETVLALFGELLVYLLFINCNGGPLFESILIGLTDLNANEKIIDSKKETLALLKEQLAAKQKKLKK